MLVQGIFVVLAHNQNLLIQAWRTSVSLRLQLTRDAFRLSF